MSHRTTYANIVQTTFNTPLVKLNRVIPPEHATVLLKLAFIPTNLDTSLLSGVETVTNDEAFAWARRLAREEGILGGISTGANVAVAVRVAARPEHRGRVIVTIAPSFGERYLSTPLYQNGR